MATQPNTILKQRTLQSIDNELQMLLALHGDMEVQLLELIQERERMVKMTRPASA